MDAVVNPDDPLFGIEGSMPDRIWRYRRETDQQAPETRGAVVRIIVRSLATKAAIRLEDLTTAAGTFIDRLYLGGSGVRNELFRQHLAAAVDFPVYAGLVDATAVGNILLQAVATGTIFGSYRGAATSYRGDVADRVPAVRRSAARQRP